jgi:hypothetical protein
MTGKQALDYLWKHIKDEDASLDEAYSVLEKIVSDSETTLEHLFGDVVGQLNKITLVDFDNETYTLNEAMEELGITEEDIEDYEDDLGTELNHIKNHFDPDK